MISAFDLRVHGMNLISTTGTTLKPATLISNKPAYFVSNLSQAKKRPDTKNPLYSALHGPTANKSAIEYTYLSPFDNSLKFPVYPIEMLSKWKNEERLYLYHGERDCVKRENKTKVNVFDWFNNDAALHMYPKHQQAYDLNEGIEKVKNVLRTDLKTVDAPDWQVKTHLARNITRGNGDNFTEAPFNWKNFLTDGGKDSQATGQLNSASNKRPRVNYQ